MMLCHRTMKFVIDALRRENRQEKIIIDDGPVESRQQRMINHLFNNSLRIVADYFEKLLEEQQSQNYLGEGI